ncbi:MAG: arylsulfatase [Acidobacteria bacterium]|nr:arylsulfatase [Acidobacteriota bacterium]
MSLTRRGLLASPAALAQPAPASKPNVILVLMDNLGWGELGVYGGGIIRGSATPRIDKLASEGMRLLNFNVEAQCTPSRAALLTGRYAVRTGNGSVPLGSPLYGLTQWEHTMAEMFSGAGYTTAMYGKWHLGQTSGRYPTDHGFEEWYGIPNSSNDAFWPDSPRFRPGSHPFVKLTQVMESRRGEEPKQVKVYDLKARTAIDAEITDRAIAFLRRQAPTRKPFFLFLPYTQPHMPVTPTEEFRGKTRNGEFADVLAQMDAYTGRLLDEVDRLGLRGNTIFIFTSDNGAEATAPYHGFTGPWRGTYFTAFEGSLRAPFIIRWPGRIPAGAVNNEIVHEMDLLPTFARLAGAKLPTDRVIDGVDQLDFLTGARNESSRESVVIYVANEIYGVKWRNWKMMSRKVERGFGEPVEQFGFPLWYDLHTDPKEENPLDPRFVENLWVRWPAGQVLLEHQASLKKEPPIPPGTPDPYVPPLRN